MDDEIMGMIGNQQPVAVSPENILSPLMLFLVLVTGQQMQEYKN